MTDSGDANVLYGIKNCDTVRKARRWLDSQGVSYRFHDFRQDGLRRQKVDGWIARAGLDAILNKRSATWKQLSDAERDLTDPSAAAALMVKHPTLIKRPVLECSGGVQVGFREQDYRDALGLT